MIIECPSCKARAKLPDSKEGAKVRCPECRFVYAAHPPGARRRASSSTPTGLYIGLGIGAVVLVGGMLMMGGDDNSSQAARTETIEEVPEPVEMVDYTGWKSAPVQAVVALHKAASVGDTVRLEQGIDEGRVWDLRQQPAEGEDEEAEGEEAAEPVADPVPWDTLERSAQLDFQKALLEELTKGDAKDLVADWIPFDGQVTEDTGDAAVVRVQVEHHDKSVSTETRSVEWKLVKDGRKWRAYSWARWYSPSELKSNRVRRSKKYDKVTLSDGSVVLEAEPRALEHYAETSAELRSEIDAQYAQMIDLELSPRDNAAAKRRLVEIGKPSLPVLLTGLYEIPLETEDQAIQVNLINQCLEEITGHYTGYKPQLDVGSGTGTSAERRNSALRQWFAWWNRKGQKFEEAETVDLLEEGLDLENMTERERREYEKYKREHEKAQREKNR